MDIFEYAMNAVYETFGEQEKIKVTDQSVTSETVIEGIFSETGQEVEPGGIVVSTSTPSLTCRIADLPNLSPNLRFHIRGFVYKIRDKDIDGYGNYNLELSKIGTQKT